ncbi:MAG TPA: tetratricopeptide repeat protein [Terriglobales bacterium]|jgi:tetratricopeptide (TPR) repeat protein|nr:tetratricopeptide repeat protein [Terriglobales bacterium]
MRAFRALVLLFAVAAFAQNSPQSREVIIIEGMVRNAAGEAVPNATVVLEQKDQPKPTETTTTNEGTFGFAPEHPGIFKITAKKAGFHDAVVDGLALSPGEKKRVNLVLEAPGSTTMEFEDKPNFTVAGVTDYTAAGGHGADTNLRTSETLARETLALKEPKAPSQANIQIESKLRGALRPGSFEANYQLGKFYMASGRYAEAVPLLETACKLRSGDFSSGYELALAYKSAGNLEKARQQAEKMLASSNRAELHRLLGDIAEQSGDSLRAVREYEAAARQEPSEQNYFEWGAELLLHRAILPAIEVFTKGSAAHPKSARMLAGLGAALYASGRYDEAAARLCAASDLKPSDELPYLFLGKMEKAVKVPLPCGDAKLARFAGEQPGNALANYYYAVALLKRGDAPQAESLLTKAVALDPKCGDAYFQLGTLYAARGEMPGAIDAYQKAIAASPELGEAHYRLGQAYKRSGDVARAEQELAAYAQLEKTQTAEVERQRHELQQFLVVLKGDAR